MEKKVFVTGASGFTGSHLVRQLLERRYSVRALVRQTSRTDALADTRAEIVYGDLTDRSTLSGLLDGIDTVFHVAAAYRQEGVPRKHFFAVNVEGTRNLLEESARAGVKRFVHCSTVGVQGEIRNPPAAENAPYQPGDEYQESKMQGEQLALQCFKENRPPGVVVRPVGIYGPGDTRFLKLFRYIHNGKFRMLGKGDILYHLTYVDDLVMGMILCGEEDRALGEVFTIGGEEYLPVRELVSLIAAILSRPVSMRRIPILPLRMAAFVCESVCRPLGIEPPIYRRRLDFFIKDRAFDISKAKRLLGYQPKVDLRTGLRLTAEWYQKEGLLD